MINRENYRVYIVIETDGTVRSTVLGYRVLVTLTGGLHLQSDLLESGEKAREVQTKVMQGLEAIEGKGESKP